MFFTNPIKYQNRFKDFIIYDIINELKQKHVLVF